NRPPAVRSDHDCEFRLGCHRLFRRRHRSGVSRRQRTVRVDRTNPARPDSARARRKRAMKSLRYICVPFGLLLIVLFGATAPAWAQASTGGLRGVVKDESGAVLVGVTVEAESPARIGGAAVEVSDAEGTYRFENLPVGVYSVSFTLQGFSTLKREGIRIEMGRSLELGVTMAVGAGEQSITLTGDEPVVAAIDSGYTCNFNH